MFGSFFKSIPKFAPKLKAIAKFCLALAELIFAFMGAKSAFV